MNSPGALSDKGLEREENQDDYGYFPMPNGELYIVADGMGGEAGEAIAARMAIDTVKQCFERNNQKYS